MNLPYPHIVQFARTTNPKGLFTYHPEDGDFLGIIDGVKPLSFCREGVYFTAIESGTCRIFCAIKFGLFLSELRGTSTAFTKVVVVI